MALRANITREVGAGASSSVVTGTVGPYRVSLTEDDSKTGTDLRHDEVGAGSEHAFAGAWDGPATVTVVAPSEGPAYGPGVEFIPTAGLLAAELGGGAAETGLFIYLDLKMNDGAQADIFRFGPGSNNGKVAWQNSSQKLRANFGGKTMQHAAASVGVGVRYQCMWEMKPNPETGPMLHGIATRIGGEWSIAADQTMNEVVSLDLSGNPLTLGAYEAGTLGGIFTLYRAIVCIGSTPPSPVYLRDNNILFDAFGGEADPALFHAYVASLDAGDGDCRLAVDVYGTADLYNAGENQAPAGVALAKNGAGLFEDAA